MTLAELGEEEACRYLLRHGCKILARNFRIPQGEIDIVASLKKTVLFVEVKTRNSDTYAKPWEAVGFRKRNRIKAAARAYFDEQPLWDHEYRFDVVSITIRQGNNPEIEWIQNAF